MKLFSFRFDIDSLADIEIGVPKLIELGNELDVRFTFFVNMGRSFNWKTIIRKSEVRSQKSEALPHLSRISSHVLRLGPWRTFRTVVFNPSIGISHKNALFKLLDNGHELGLHGGMDHPLWQWELDTLRKDEINDLLKPAYDYFVKLFGKPKGFASPGFRYNRSVLELIDEYGFEYASDMEGELPFRPEGFRHMQIPVNVTGADQKPVIEYLRASGLSETEVKEKISDEIEKRDIAVMYGHPAFEGRFGCMEELIAWVKVEGYKIVLMREVARKK